MKTNKLHVAWLLGLLTVLSFSCSDDEDPDVRDQSVGTYNYTGKAYILDGTTLEYLGSDFDTDGTYVVEKNSDGIVVKEGGTVQFQGNKVTKVSNGFTFDINSQPIVIDGDTYTISGYQGVTVSGSSTKYHGYFNKDAKKIETYFQFTIEDGDGNEYILVFAYIGTKI